MSAVADDRVPRVVVKLIVCPEIGAPSVSVAVALITTVSVPLAVIRLAPVVRARDPITAASGSTSTVTVADVPLAVWAVMSRSFSPYAAAASILNTPSASVTCSVVSRISGWPDSRMITVTRSFESLLSFASRTMAAIWNEPLGFTRSGIAYRIILAAGPAVMVS